MKKIVIIWCVLSVSVGMLLLTGCEEIEVETVSQLEEVERYLSDSEIGRELFSQDYLKHTVSYTFTGNDTVYDELFQSTQRSYQVDIPGLLTLPYGEYYYATVQVTDDVTYTLRKSINTVNIDTTLTKRFTRKAFLVKLGENDQSFSGWVLKGYNGGQEQIPVDITDKNSQAIKHGVHLLDYNTEIENLKFFPSDSITMIPDGSDLYVSGDAGGKLYSVHYAPTGLELTDIDVTPTTPSLYDDTLATPSNNTRFWSLIHLFNVTRSNDSTNPGTMSWFIPYKIQK